MTLCQRAITMAGFLVVVLMLVDEVISARENAAIIEIKGDDFEEESPATMFPSRRLDSSRPNPEPNFLLWNSRKLKKILGEFDARYESVKKPRYNATRGGGEATLSRKELLASMPSELKNRQFTLFGSERELGTRASKKLRLWLWSVSSCSVLPRWKDSGPTIWPRYINMGQCPQKSCSYPKGMKCTPSKYKRIPRLWWFCNRRIATDASPCTWAKFYTKVVEKCTCGCQSKERNNRRRAGDSLLSMLPVGRES